MIRDILQKHITLALSSLGFPEQEIVLDHPAVPEHGDYASNIALRVHSKQSRPKADQPLAETVNSNKINPREIATSIVEQLNKDDELKKVVSKIEIAGPGFINFWLSQKYLVESMGEIVTQKDSFGKPEQISDKKVIIEFGQPNTHKLPHIGHFRSFSLGESLARILEFSGNKLIRVNYQGDVGLHVAKCLWGWQKKELSDAGALTKNIQLLQVAYQYGSQEYENNEEYKKEIEDINTKIYEKDQSIVELWEKTRNWCLDYYQKLNARLGTHYDKEYFESQTSAEGKKLVTENTGTVFELSEGAIIFRGENVGLHNRVFISQKGNPTYEAKDLGLAFLKSRDFEFDKSYITTANEQVEYFKVVYKAVEHLDKNLAAKFQHIPFGMVTLKGAKLSSRTGNIVSIEELLSAVSSELRVIMQDKEYTAVEIQSVLEPLTIAAAKYALLKNAAHQTIVFDLEESVSLEGNSGPYLEYTHARCRSLLSKVANHSYESRVTGHELKDEEVLLLRQLYLFPEIVEAARNSFSPHGICTYLFSLAKHFNLFYQTVPILNSTGNEKEFRIGLTAATAQVLKNGLTVLGIPVLEKM